MSCYKDPEIVLLNKCEDDLEKNNVRPFFPPQDENDVYILTKVSDILHSVFSSYKEKVLPWFEQLLQLIVQLIVSTSCFQISRIVLIDFHLCRHYQ